MMPFGDFHALSLYYHFIKNPEFLNEICISMEHVCTKHQA